MFQITGNVSESLADEISKAAAWFFKKYGSLPVKIRFALIDANDKACIQTRPNHYEITLNKLHSFRGLELKESLFHELWHAVQIQTGALAQNGRRLFFAKRDVTDIPYINQPHEIEARRMATKLVIEYMTK